MFHQEGFHHKILTATHLLHEVATLTMILTAPGQVSLLHLLMATRNPREAVVDIAPLREARATKTNTPVLVVVVMAAVPADQEDMMTTHLILVMARIHTLHPRVVATLQVHLVTIEAAPMAALVPDHRHPLVAHHHQHHHRNLMRRGATEVVVVMVVEDQVIVVMTMGDSVLEVASLTNLVVSARDRAHTAAVILVQDQVGRHRLHLSEVLLLLVAMEDLIPTLLEDLPLLFLLLVHLILLRQLSVLRDQLVIDTTAALPLSHEVVVLGTVVQGLTPLKSQGVEATPPILLLFMIRCPQPHPTISRAVTTTVNLVGSLALLSLSIPSPLPPLGTGLLQDQASARAEDQSQGAPPVQATCLAKGTLNPAHNIRQKHLTSTCNHVTKTPYINM